MELFKVIEEFPNYQISNLGNIKNNKDILLKIGKRISNSGYIQVRLSKEGKYYYRYIHRLLAKAFLPNPNNYRTINHINGNKHDNRVENLEWLTHSENMKHAYKIGLNRISEKQSEAIKKANTKYKKGKPLSEEHKKKLGEALARRNKDKEWRKIHYANKSNKI